MAKSGERPERARERESPLTKRDRPEVRAGKITSPWYGCMGAQQCLVHEAADGRRYAILVLGDGGSRARQPVPFSEGAGR